MNCIPVDKKGYPVRGLTDDVGYSVPDGITLIYTDLPHALSLYKKRWTGTEWIETAAPEEIEKWKYPDGHPEEIAPPISTSELAEELDLTQIAVAESYDKADSAEHSAEVAMMAIDEMYGTMSGAIEGLKQDVELLKQEITDLKGEK